MVRMRQHQRPARAAVAAAPAVRTTTGRLYWSQGTLILLTSFSFVALTVVPPVPIVGRSVDGGGLQKRSSRSRKSEKGHP